jgi:hypothetical protein
MFLLAFSAAIFPARFLEFGKTTWNAHPIIGPFVGGQPRYLSVPPPPSSPWAQVPAWQAQFGPIHRGNFFGFKWYSGPIYQWPMNLGPVMQMGDAHTLRLPYWLPLLILGVIPTIWISKRWPTRKPPGICTLCGYDLRATPNRCPECGTIAQTKSIPI